MHCSEKTDEKLEVERETQSRHVRRHETATGRKEETQRSRDQVRKQQRRKDRRAAQADRQ